jgi:tetratricopeptide (TPR) repeat protein
MLTPLESMSANEYNTIIIKTRPYPGEAFAAHGPEGVEPVKKYLSVLFSCLLISCIFHLGAAGAQTYSSAHESNTFGVTAYQSKQYDKALSLFQQAISMDPQNPVYHNNLGLALDALSRAREAIEEYRVALKLNPNYVDALNNIGVAFYNQGMFKDAADVWAQALKLEPSSSDIQANYRLAMAQLVQMPREGELPFSASKIFEEGKSLFMQRKYEDAISAFREVIAIKPGSSVSHYYLGLCLRALGADYDALSSFMTVLDLDSRNAWAAYHMALIYEKMGLLQRAKRYMKKALSLDPELRLLSNN